MVSLRANAQQSHKSGLKDHEQDLWDRADKEAEDVCRHAQAAGKSIGELVYPYRRLTPHIGEIEDWLDAELYIARALFAYYHHSS